MILKILDNIEKYICQFLLAIFVCILFAQIISREVFGYSIPWSEEFSTYLFGLPTLALALQLESPHITALLFNINGYQKIKYGFLKYYPI